MRRIVLALVTVSAAGCTNGCLVLPNVTVLGQDCRSRTKPMGGLAVVGEPSTLAAGVQLSCDRSVPKQATKTTVTVTGPAGVGVAHVESEVTHDYPWTNQVTVTFTPPSPGAYKIAVAFEPGAGTAEYELNAATHRKEPGQVMAWAGPVDCLKFAITSKGTLSCLRHWQDPHHFDLPRPPPEVVTNRGQTLQGLAFAIREDTLWRLVDDSGGHTLERLVDDGVAYQRTHALAIPGASGPMVIIGGDLWLVGSSTMLIKAHPEAAGTLTISSLLKPASSADGTSLSVDGLAGNEQGMLIWSNKDLNTPEMTFVRFTDPSQLGLAVTRPMAGPQFKYTLTAWDEDTLWTEYSFYSGQDHFIRYRLVSIVPGDAQALSTVEARAEYSQHISIRMQDPLFGFFPPALSLRPESVHWKDLPREPQALPKVVGEAVEFEFFDVGDGYEQVRSTTRKHAFAPAMDGKSVKVFTR